MKSRILSNRNSSLEDGVQPVDRACFLRLLYDLMKDDDEEDDNVFTLLIRVRGHKTGYQKKKRLDGRKQKKYVHRSTRTQGNGTINISSCGTPSRITCNEAMPCQELYIGRRLPWML